MNNRKTKLLCVLLLGLLGCQQQTDATFLKESTSVFEFPSTSSSVIQELKKGAKVTFDFSYQDWCNIILPIASKQPKRAGYVDCNALGIMPKQGSLSDKTVILDAGHGGKERGAYYFDVAEKDINLQLTKDTAKYLRENGINVVLPRKGDETIRLYTRVSYANLLGLLSIYLTTTDNTKKHQLEGYMRELQQIILDNAAEIPPLYQKQPITGAINPTLYQMMQFTKNIKSLIVVSIHSNATLLPQQGATGLELILTGNAIQEKYPGYHVFNEKERIALRDYLKTSLVESGVIDFRKTFFGDFAILRESNLPSVMIEAGYLNNPNDFVVLSQPITQQKLAKAISNGITNWFRQS